MKKIFLASVLSVSASVFCFADNYSDLAKYDAGNSLAWFFNLRTETQNVEKSEIVVQKICQTISENKLSQEAFRLACNLLKPIANEDCIEVLKPYLLDSQRCPYVCDVFITLNDSDVDDALKNALKKAMSVQDANKEPMTNIKENIINAMATRGKDKASMIEVANSKNKKLAIYAVRALSRFSDDDSLLSIFETSVVSALRDIVAKNDYRKKDAQMSLVLIAEKSIMAGKNSVARDALKDVPENCPLSVYARAELMSADERISYLDKLIADGTILTKSAGRAMNKGRNFENSKWLIEKFPTLNREAKLAAVGSFMITGDTRFYPTIAPEIDNPDSDIRDLAVYSARFLCTDEANFNKIYKLFKLNEEPVSKFAENVLVENPSYAVQRVLKEKADAGDMDALEILIRRGDEQYRMKLWNMFFDEKTRTSAVCRMLENTITSGQINLLATNYKVGDNALSKEITKIIIKKMMQYRQSREYIAKAVKIALDGNLDKNDANYKFIVSKLKIEDLMK